MAPLESILTSLWFFLLGPVKTGCFSNHQTMLNLAPAPRGNAQLSGRRNVRLTSINVCTGFGHAMQNSRVKGKSPARVCASMAGWHATKAPVHNRWLFVLYKKGT